MKKIGLLAILTLVVAFALSGCSSKDTIKIESNTWTMTTIQSGNADGQVVAYGADGSSTLETSVLVQLECKAEKGVLTLTDSTKNQTYTGSYKVIDTNPDSVIYDVEIGNIKGNAVSALTTYSNEKSKPTLIITLGDYALNFFAKETK